MSNPSLAGATALLTSATTAAAGAATRSVSATKTYQANGVTTSGAGSATIAVQGSNDDGTSWDTIGTITLTLSTTSSSDSFASDDRYTWLRGNVTAISGTGASVDLTMGY
jgi:hypothetical protein